RASIMQASSRPAACVPNLSAEGSTTIDPRLQGDAPGQAGDGLLQPLVELGVLVVARLVQVRYPAVLDEAPRAAALVPVPGVPDPEGEAAGPPYDGKAGNVGIAVAYEDHLVEGHAQPIPGHLAVDLERLARVCRADDALLHMEEVAGL